MELWPESLLESSNLLTLLLEELEDCMDDRAEDDLPAELSAKTELEDDIAEPLDWFSMTKSWVLLLLLPPR